eukprot:gene8012-64280_t
MPPTERALYIAQRKWLAGRADADRELLPFCSHFDPDALLPFCSHFDPDALLPFCSHFDPDALTNADTATAAVEKVLARQRRERAAQDDTVRATERQLAALDYKGFASADAQDKARRRIEERLALERGALGRMSGAIAFLESALKYVDKLRKGEAHECAVCMEDCPPDRIAAIIRELRRIHAADPAARVLVFHDDSGLNLTISNHVFFVHPMRQALGRVRRRGQQRDVHLYRFV